MISEPWLMTTETMIPHSPKSCEFYDGTAGDQVGSVGEHTGPECRCAKKDILKGLCSDAK